MKGRKRTPLKILQARGSQYANENHVCGDYRKNELNPDGEKPICPESLEGIAKDKWNQIIEQLMKHGIICLLDTDALEVYCETYAIWKEAMKGAKKGLYITVENKNGGKEVKINPSVKIANEAAGVINRIGSDFGLSPVARTRVKTTKPKTKEDEAEAFLNNA